MAKIHHSPLKVEIPALDVPSYVFSSGTPTSRRSPQYFDADNPARNFSLSQAENLVRRVGKGLHDLGLGPDDKVLLYAGNSLYFPVLLWGTLAAGCVFTGCSPGASVTGNPITCVEVPVRIANYFIICRARLSTPRVGREKLADEFRMQFQGTRSCQSSWFRQEKNLFVQ